MKRVDALPPRNTRAATCHTNSAEGYFSIFKRGMRGVYQHCKEKHLHRYLAEYDFRYNHRVALRHSRQGACGARCEERHGQASHVSGQLTKPDYSAIKQRQERWRKKRRRKRRRNRRQLELPF